MTWTENERADVLADLSRLGWVVLRRFSAEYKPSEILAAFSALSETDFRHLRVTHFLRSEEVGGFVYDDVPAFLKAIPTATFRPLEEQRGAPRGVVQWQRTLSKRAQGGVDPTIFVSRPVERTSDSTPARLVAYLLQRIVSLGGSVSRTALPLATLARLEATIDMAKRHLSVLRNRGVRVPNVLVPSDLGHLRRSRRGEVVSSLQLYDLYVHTIEKANPHLLQRLLEQSMLAPESQDDLFEVWALLTLVESHLAEGWSLTQARLISGDGVAKYPRFVLEKDSQRVEIFFQSTPSALTKVSAYKSLFSDYDLDRRARRPDLTVHVTGDDCERYYLVEVKRTSDPDYIADSVYKTLGYVSDFRDALGPDSPLAILLVWGGISMVKEAREYRAVQVFTAVEFKAMPLPY